MCPCPCFCTAISAIPICIPIFQKGSPSSAIRQLLIESNPSGLDSMWIRPHRSLLAILCSWLLLQETLFPYHIVIYGAQSWVFTCHFPGWQVVAEPYTPDGLKPLPISCLNAFGDSLCLGCSWAKVGAWVTALPPLMNRAKNNPNEQFARLDKPSSCRVPNEITFPVSFQFTPLFLEQTCHTF